MQPRHSDTQRGFLAGRLELLERDLWREDLGRFPAWRAAPYRLGRLLVAAAQSFLEHRGGVRAAALTFITLLSLVPLLALAFAVAKGLGAYDDLLQRSIRPYLDGLSTGEEGGGQLRQAIDQILEFVNRTNFSTLGVLGLLLLIATTVQLLASIEGSLNDIWGVRRARTVVRKLTDYLTIVVIAPILLLVATSVTAAAQSNAVVDWLEAYLPVKSVLELLLRVTPLLVVWLGMAFVLHTLPNAVTNWRSSLLGGVVGGTAWQLAQVAHVEFQIGVARYNAIYAGFAALPIFLVWLQLSWQIVLFAAEIAHAHQARLHEHARADAGDSHAWREELGLWLVLRAAERFAQAEPPLSAQDYALAAGTSERQVERTLAALVSAGILVETHGRVRSGYGIARDPRSIRALDVLDALRSADARGQLGVRGRPLDQRVRDLVTGLESQTSASALNRSLHELISVSSN